MEKLTPSAARQAWLESGLKALRPWFLEHGYTVPLEVRVSIGFPRGSHGKGTAIGQCWDKSASKDKHNEIFISPALFESVKILGVMCHELVHATVGLEHGHKSAFKQCALAVGLDGKMTATTEAEIFVAFGKDFVKDFGEYPAAPLNPNMRKKQSTRLLKCECEECGYIARVTKTWIEASGAPFCGIKSHGRMLTDDLPDDE